MSVSIKGGVTKSKILVGPESHKLHLEFNLSEEAGALDIHMGQPCKVVTNDAGEDVVVPATFSEPEYNILGISIHEVDSAYKGAIVLATRGYAVIYAQASGAIEAGAPVKVGDGSAIIYDAATGYPVVSAAFDTASETTTTHETAYQPTYLASVQMGWALEYASDAEIIEVLVKN
jgi:hypothetical protein